MQIFTFYSQVSSDGILRLELPINTPNSDLKVTGSVQQINNSKRSHTDSKKRFEQMLKKI